MSKLYESKPVVFWTYTWGVGLITCAVAGALLFLVNEWPEVSVASFAAVLGFGFISVIWWTIPFYLFVLMIILIAHLFVIKNGQIK